MTRQLTLANAHSEHKPTQKIVLEMEGGSPWFRFTYLWINDQLFVASCTDGSSKITIKPKK